MPGLEDPVRSSSSARVLMRSAGCAINDYADRDFDPHVARTTEPAARGAAGQRRRRRCCWRLCLALIAFVLILPLNRLTILLSFCALFLAAAIRSPSASSPCRRPISASPSASASRWPTPRSSGHVPAVGWVLLAANVLLDHRLRHRVRDGRSRRRP